MKSDSTKHQIAVVGAAGHTGRFVVAELLRRGFAPIAIARDSSRLDDAGFPRHKVVMRAGTLDDPDSLDRCLADADAVINCAGPFLDTANSVVEAALRAGIHYVDVTAEQPSAQSTFERYSAAAEAAGVVVMPALGFYGGFPDLLASALMRDWDFVDEIHIAIALSRWWPTRGTRITGQRNTAQRLIIEDGKLMPLAKAEHASWDFGKPFGAQQVTVVPLSEMVLIARHIHVSQVRTYLNDAPLRDLRDPATPPPTASDDSGRSEQIFLVEVRAHQGGMRRRIAARGRDIYAFTAPLVIEGVARILAGRISRVGAVTPGEVFEPLDFLRSLEAHCVVEVR